MQRQRYSLTDFGGIINRADMGDIPDNAATDSNNIDGDAPEGYIRAIPTAVTKPNDNNLAQASRLFEWIKTKDGKWNLVHVDAANINVMKDFYATTPTAGITPVACVATSMVAHNEEVHVAVGSATLGTPAAPNWTGYCDYGQFGGSVLGWKSLSAVLAIPVQTTDYTITLTGHTVTPPAVTPFDVDKLYHYNVTFTYDGSQESPMGSGYQTFSISSYGANPDYVTVDLAMKTVASLNSRITGMNLYRREADPSTGLPTTLWRLQQSFNATTSVAYVDRLSANQSWGGTTDKTISYVDNNTDVFSSYEDQTGLPETLRSSDVYYTFNTDLNAFHFVAGCLKSGLPDASMMVFRSKQYRYDMFDWTNDYLKLPTVPTALKAFNGKIWAFDENHLYRINPDGMYIEDSTDGIGCLSQRSVVVTDYGMFWCDDKNAYWHNGEAIIPIGDPIKTDYSGTAQWTGFAVDYTRGSQFLTTIAVFHAPKNTVLFIAPDHAAASGESNVWAFHVQRKRWDKWLAFSVCGATTTGFGAFSGRGGEVYVSTGSTLVEALAGTTWRSFYWVSKVLDFGSPSRQKKFYNLIADNTSTTAAPTYTYNKDKSASPPATAFTGTPPTREFKSGGVWEQGKTIQIKIAEATGYGNIIYSMDVLYRNLDEL